MFKGNNNTQEENKVPFWDQFSSKFLHIGSDFNPWRISIRITGIYLLLGMLWILLSDRILGLIVYDKQTWILISTMKGELYVLLTGLIIFGLIHSSMRRIKMDEKKIIKSYEELAATYEELEAAHEELTAAEEELRQQYDTQTESRKQLAESEERLHHMAYHDLLTGLRNRLAIYEDLSAIFVKNPETRGVLFFIDLDDFKFINDSMGHSFGDQLLRRIGERLAQLFWDVGTVYRLAGDEFVVYIQGYEVLEEVAGYVLKILDHFKAPLKIGNSVFHTTISIGTAMYPEHGSNPDELLKCADMAMHKAKKAGKNRFVIFDQAMSEAVSERIVIENHLRTALEKNEFQIHYQPQLDLKTGRIAGFEALLRWQSPELGSVSPNKFIKIAEDTHLIIDIGKWVIQNACCFIKKLRRNGYADLYVSVNISMLQLLQDDFADEVIMALSSPDIEPGCLELEITESILMESFDIIGSKLMKLQHHGVRIALDDFGKGYSSLHYLLRLPITTLKVDKSFIDSILLETQEKALAGQIITIGKSMGLCVVAEGVETQEQLDYLLEHNCHKIQGYIFSKPVPEPEAEALLSDENFLQSKIR